VGRKDHILLHEVRITPVEDTNHIRCQDALVSDDLIKGKFKTLYKTDFDITVGAGLQRADAYPSRF
jgi:hypothetical protein